MKFKKGDRVTLDYEDNPRGALDTRATVLSAPRKRKDEFGRTITCYLIRHESSGYREEWDQKYLTKGWAYEEFEELE